MTDINKIDDSRFDLSVREKIHKWSNIPISDRVNLSIRIAISIVLLVLVALAHAGVIWILIDLVETDKQIIRQLAADGRSAELISAYTRIIDRDVMLALIAAVVVEVVAMLAAVVRFIFPKE